MIDMYFEFVEYTIYKLRELNLCWNDAFRRVFVFKRNESVKELQYGTW